MGEIASRSASRPTAITNRSPAAAISTGAGTPCARIAIPASTPAACSSRVLEPGAKRVTSDASFGIAARMAAGSFDCTTSAPPIVAGESPVTKTAPSPIQARRSLSMSSPDCAPTRERIGPDPPSCSFSRAPTCPIPIASQASPVSPATKAGSGRGPRSAPPTPARSARTAEPSAWNRMPTAVGSDPVTRPVASDPSIPPRGRCRPALEQRAEREVAAADAVVALDAVQRLLERAQRGEVVAPGGVDRRAHGGRACPTTTRSSTTAYAVPPAPMRMSTSS